MPSSLACSNQCNYHHQHHSSLWVLLIYGKIGVLHNYGNKHNYATHKIFSQQNWQLSVIFPLQNVHYFFPRKHRNNFSIIIQHNSYRGVTQLRKLLYILVNILDILRRGGSGCLDMSGARPEQFFADTLCLYLRPWEARLQQFTASLDDYTDGVTQRRTLGRRIEALKKEHWVPLPLMPKC